jgi:hypothetical protein
MPADGLRKIYVIKTGDRSYCIIGEWDSALIRLTQERGSETAPAGN